jgi:hypothetical protein
MQEKLFDIRQVLLFIGNIPGYDGAELVVNELISELGFSSKVLIYGHTAMNTKNLYSGYFEGFSDGAVLETVKEKIHQKCIEKGIGMLDFFLIDATEAPMFKSIWHDGFY